MAADGARASAVQRYRFVSRLATGGMAEVYVADATGVAGVKRRVALKRVLPNLAKDRSFVEMFLNEARIASTLQHPNIVQTYDVIDNHGEYYIAMELLEGCTLLELRQQLAQRQTLPSAPHVFFVMDRVLAGLHYAHERTAPEGRALHVVHRDVSPHNVFLTRDGHVKLLDFGVAKAEAMLGRESSGSGVVKGKVLYMSPEQCQGLEVDRTSDVYATGALMYALLTGTHPFRGANPYDTMRAVIYQTPAAPSSIVPALGPAIDAIVMRAMAKAPADRYRTAREMQLALAAVVRDRAWYVTDLDLAAVVDTARPRWPTEPDVSQLPADLVIGDRVEPSVELPDASPPAEVVAETPHAVVERVRGVTVLTLRSAIDERFDPTIARHLRGVVLIDSGDVTRITSYGLRGLLEVVDRSAPAVDAVYHLRCSVPFVQQVGMIRRLLGGGKVVSFQLPYVDPLTGQVFTHTVSGLEAAATLASRVPPAVPCPAAPERQAEFDEEADSYLSFAEDLCVDPPPHVARVSEALSLKEKRRQVEKEITQSGLVVYIRRPLDDTFRWRTLLAGVEGRVRLDLDATPTWTDAGLDRLLDALERESSGIVALELLHMPSELYRKLERRPRLRALVRGGSIRLHATCPRCNA
ncbi:MAG: serine/threonine-protein kinase, partial [Myxococcota bacterium]